MHYFLQSASGYPVFFTRSLDFFFKVQFSFREFHVKELLFFFRLAMVMNLLFQIQLRLVQRPTVEEFNSKKNYDLSFTAFFGSSHEAIKNFENVIPKIYFDNNIVHKISMIEKTHTQYVNYIKLLIILETTFMKEGEAFRIQLLMSLKI